MFAVNATGTDKREPLIIGKAFKPRAFYKKTGEELGFYYGNNAKAWMTAVIYTEWIQRWDRELRRNDLRDQSTSGHAPCIRAWDAVKEETIANCWRKSGILPTNLSGLATIDEGAEAELELGLTLDQLAARGVLHVTNRLSINDLLNPEGEQGGVEHCTDEELLEAVHRSLEKEDGEEETEEVVKPPRTLKEVLFAAQVLEESLDLVGDPYASKLVTLLNQHCREMRLEASSSLRDQTLHQFFGPRVENATITTLAKPGPSSSFVIDLSHEPTVLWNQRMRCESRYHRQIDLGDGGKVYQVWGMTDYRLCIVLCMGTNVVL
ncbi:hypothetical protein TREMEDRAFT_61029 [Tremella mesenterica DSM 1558]|uniref:uncharacterized protein n=1 Tax=Tremella mesenterica (strain ATCC 24925 / CBS 8224 / DSM 1558 / NBRC 9311 / NRRL Y-6157 / RJB 2259-6 / UBC 559-6) TaxID=578456 RepID=UPI0003F49E48|nr:uncharacterized protein TREMEDRAFT_61029 [Tremella mesenterica DSM 1558]EIW70525.1 hypothetical protein TREMEDRAFT_61029 [Tremella mesenterica DSM 1558]